MLELDKITTLYSQEQDRLSLNATLRGGGAARFWITQRIANRLIPALIKIVKPSHEDPVYVELIAGISQRQAIAQKEPQTPVKMAEPDHEWLISKIDLQMPQSGAVLIFYNAAGQSARVVMNAELLRQWLSILRQVYVAAEWRGAEWPDWVAAPSARKTADKVLH